MLALASYSTRVRAMNENSQTDLRMTMDHALAQEWELVLLSQGLSPQVRQGPDGFVLSVPQKQASRALAGLRAYESENSAKLMEESSPVNRPSLLVMSATIVILILGFYAFTVASSPPWFERGSADALRILHGELWRAVTALTLHADSVHALSNAVGIALFLHAVCGMLGGGLGSALVLLSGVAGNLANAVFHGDSHVSLGASTAVFGAVGILAALGVARRRHAASVGRRAWLPVAAALGLIAMLGTGGQRVDVWAHLFGLLAGGMLGSFAAYVAPRGPGLLIQWVCGGIAAGALVFCWVLALR
jgi:membrane associated rhomboid family serine protease